MKIKIADYCIRCGLCVDLYPDIYYRNYEGHDINTAFSEIPEEYMERVKESARDCAVGAISIK